MEIGIGWYQKGYEGCQRSFWNQNVEKEICTENADMEKRNSLRLFEQTDSSFADWTKEQKNKNKKIKEKERDMDLMWWSVWDFETGRQRCLEAIKIMSKGFG